MLKRLLGAIRPAVLVVPIAVFLVMIMCGVASGENFIAALKTAFTALMVNGSWLVSLGVLAFVVFMVFVMVHPVGNIRLGGRGAKPEYSLWNWFAISLCAGIGTGIVFWGPVEPLLFTAAPQAASGVAANSYEAVLWAFDKSYLHWSFAPYACYCVFGVVLAYAIYNMRAPFSVSSGFAFLKRMSKKPSRLAGIVDTFMVFALVGGVAGSLGYGLLQIGSGMSTVFGLEVSPALYVGICIVIVVTFTVASVTGMDRGIRWFADKNAWMFLALMLLAFFFGPAQWICNLFAETVGHFLNGFVASITAVTAFPDSGSVAGAAWAGSSELWPQWWDEYYFVDFLSFGAIVGLFSIKLAKGRTLRQYVVMNWLVPALFGIVWFAVFGGLALDIQYNFAAYADKVDLQGCASLYAYMQQFGNEAMMLKVVEALPFSFLLKPLILLLVAISFVTLADSMTSTISQITLRGESAGEGEAPMPIKVMWGVVIGAVAVVFTLTGNIEGIKIVKTTCGYPVLIIGILMMLGFLMALSRKGSALNAETHGERSGLGEAVASEAVDAE